MNAEATSTILGRLMALTTQGSISGWLFVCGEGACVATLSLRLDGGERSITKMWSWLQLAVAKDVEKIIHQDIDKLLAELTGE